MNYNRDFSDKRLEKKPTYKVGDIVVYPNRYIEKGYTVQLFQSKIIEASALLEQSDKEDTLSWYYETEQTVKDCEDVLTERDIFYQI